MAPKKEKVKMDLGSFLADDSFGGNDWVDDEIDLNSLNIPSARGSLDVGTGFGKTGLDSSASQYGGSNPSYGNRESRGPRYERVEYPVPDVAPFAAKLSNIPLNNIHEEDIEAFFVEKLNLTDPIIQIRKLEVPIDRRTGGIKGFAFIEFDTKELLVEALKLSESYLGERKLYVAVAAPESERPQRSHRDEPELDWGSARGTQEHAQPRQRFNPRGDGERSERPPRPEQPDLDWGSARGTQERAQPRQRFNPRGDGERSERPPRPEQPDLDWGSARGTQEHAQPRQRFTPRGDGERSERPPRPEQPQLDWGSARGTQEHAQPRQRFTPRGDGERSERPQRKREEPDLDWGSARSSQEQVTAKKFVPRHIENRRQKKQEELDWNSARSSVAQAKPQQPKAKKAAAVEEQEEKVDTPKKSGYALLGVEGEDEEDEEEKEEKKTTESKTVESAVEQITESTANVSLSGQEGWEVVNKK